MLDQPTVRYDTRHFDEANSAVRLTEGCLPIMVQLEVIQELIS